MIGCPKISAPNYQSTLCNIAEVRRPQLRDGRSLKPQTANESKINHEDIAVQVNKISGKQSDIKS
jgi:hypothetical protein